MMKIMQLYILAKIQCFTNELNVLRQITSFVKIVSAEFVRTKDQLAEVFSGEFSIVRLRDLTVIICCPGGSM